MSDPYSGNTVLLLRMEGSNGSTAFVDSSSFPRLITANGDAQISTAQSKWGNGSGYFDGSGDYLSLLSNELSLVSGDFTIEFWFYVTEVRDHRMVGNRSPNGWLIAATSSIIQFSFWETNGTYTPVLGPSISFSAWNHIAACRSGNTYTTYVNGAGGSPVTTAARPAAGGSTVQIGRDASVPSTNPLKGFIQDLRITKGIARYTDTFTPPARLPDPDPAVCVLGASARLVDLEDGGALSVIEPVTRMNSPVSRRVRLCDQISGRVVREQWSDPATGLVTFTDLREGPWALYALDHTGEFEAVAISDRVATVDGARP